MQRWRHHFHHPVFARTHVISRKFFRPRSWLQAQSSPEHTVTFKPLSLSPAAAATHSARDCTGRCSHDIERYLTFESIPIRGYYHLENSWPAEVDIELSQFYLLTIHFHRLIGQFFSGSELHSPNLLRNTVKLTKAPYCPAAI